MTLWSKSECYYPTKNGWTPRNNLQKSQKRLWEKLDSLLALLRIMELLCSMLNVAWLLSLKQFSKYIHATFTNIFKGIFVNLILKSYLNWRFEWVREAVQNQQNITKPFQFGITYILSKLGRQYSHFPEFHNINFNIRTYKTWNREKNRR